jgi:hypothetical protein
MPIWTYPLFMPAIDYLDLSPFYPYFLFILFMPPKAGRPQAAQRTAPMAMLLYGLIVCWYCQEGHRHYRPLARPWYLQPKRASFADMLATLRRRSLRETISAWAPQGPGSQKIIQLVETILALAA